VPEESGTDVTFRFKQGKKKKKKKQVVEHLPSKCLALSLSSNLSHKKKKLLRNLCS
jgi:hypothetical protein